MTSPGSSAAFSVIALVLRMRLPVLFCVLAALATGCLAQTPPAPRTGDDGRRTLAPDTQRTPMRAPPGRRLDAAVVYEAGRASADGTGRFYLGREIARVMSHRGAAWLERPDRAREERPDLLLDLLDLQPSDVVADLGAGTGYFTFRLAPRVPRGRVLAVDIQPEMLTIVERRADAEGVPNVVTVLGTEENPGLAERSVDLTLLVDSYHEFSYPAEMLAGVYRATRPGGRLVLVEYRAEDPDVPIRPLHKMTESQVRREVEAAGFTFVENLDRLPQQHVLVFQRPASDGR